MERHASSPCPKLWIEGVLSRLWLSLCPGCWRGWGGVEMCPMEGDPRREGRHRWQHLSPKVIPSPGVGQGHLSLLLLVLLGRPASIRGPSSSPPGPSGGWWTDSLLFFALVCNGELGEGRWAPAASRGLWVPLSPLNVARPDRLAGMGGPGAFCSAS